MKLVTLLVLLLSSHGAFADRTVNVMSADKAITLSNSSAVPVTYNISCYNQAGTSTVSMTAETLAANTSKAYGGSADISTVTAADACSGTADSGLMNHVSCGTVMQVKLCPGAATYANASTLCGPGLTMCNYISGNYMSCGTTAAYWVGPPAGALEVSPDGGCTYNTLTGTQALAISDRYNCSSAMYSQGCRVDGADFINSGCGADNVAANHGTVCCAMPSASFCKVTITSADVNAYLSSPGFKGGAPF